MSTSTTIRAARQFAAAQYAYDSRAEPDYDEDALTEDDALEQAEAEKLHTPQTLLDAFGELCERDDRQIPLAAVQSAAFDPTEMSAERLFVLTLYGSVSGREMARNELASRLQTSMAEQIDERAAELLREEERFFERLSETN